MGKCLSCCNRQNVSNMCLNEPTNIKNKVEKSNPLVMLSDKKKLSYRPYQQNRSIGTSHFSISGLYRRVSGNRSSSLHLNHLESTFVPDSSIKIPTVSKSKHFSPLVHNKICNSGEHDIKFNKRSAIHLEVKLNNLFNKYKDAEDDDMILMEGIEKLCTDLNLQPDDFKILILAWKLNAEQMCQFTRKEFIEGCVRIDADSISQINNRLCEIAVQLKTDQLQFKHLYRFTFKFGLDQTVGQRILPVDMALSLWKLVFTIHKPPILDRWLIFLQSDKTHIRGIPRDTWNMFLNFSETVGNDLSTYDDTEAWPSIFDDFVEYENNCLNKNVESLNVTYSRTNLFCYKSQNEGTDV